MWWIPLATAALDWWSGKEAARKAGRGQADQTRKDAAAGVIGRVEGAKAAGLHPLAGLGTTVGGSTLPVGPSFNSSGIDEAAVAYRQMKMRREELEYQKDQDAQNRRRDAEMDALTKASAAREVESQGLRNELLKAQIEAQRKMMSDSDRDFAASQAQLARQSPSIPLRKPIPPQYVPVRDRFGKTQMVPNPQFYDLELPESVGAATLAIPEVQNSSWLNETWEGVKRYFRRSKANPQGLPDPVSY